MQNTISIIKTQRSVKGKHIIVSLNIGITLNEMKTNTLIEAKQVKRSDSVRKSISRECYLRGRKAELQENNEKAIHFYNKALKFNPANIEAFDRRGVVHMNMMRYAEALRDFVLALRVDANYVEAINHLGLVNCALKRYDEALDNFSLALRINPQFGKAYFNRALLKLTFDDFQGARRDIIRSVATDNFGYEESRLNSYKN